jgi:hypothetical protein
MSGVAARMSTAITINEGKLVGMPSSKMGKVNGIKFRRRPRLGVFEYKT